ncbi:MAG: hypothetical protein FWB74_05020 [Defluviitaleaceae bacterium]|nr:hypothetical protein [Defluviitaleaceae bacterium]
MNYTLQDTSGVSQNQGSVWASNVLSGALVVAAFFVIYAVARAKNPRKSTRARKTHPDIPMITPKGVKRDPRRKR